MKLHKLTYSAHGWSLAIFGAPLVADAPEAWDHGLVFPLIRARVLEFGCYDMGRKLSIVGRSVGFPLSRSQQDFLRRVWKRYSEFSAGTLSSMTHESGTPWAQTYRRRGLRTVIGDDLMKSTTAIARGYSCSERSCLPLA